CRTGWPVHRPASPAWKHHHAHHRWRRQPAILPSSFAAGHVRPPARTPAARATSAGSPPPGHTAPAASAATSPRHRTRIHHHPAAQGCAPATGTGTDRPRQPPTHSDQPACLHGASVIVWYFPRQLPGPVKRTRSIAFTRSRHSQPRRRSRSPVEATTLAAHRTNPEASRWPVLVDALRSMWQRFFLFLALLSSGLPGYADETCRGWLDALDVALA